MALGKNFIAFLAELVRCKLKGIEDANTVITMCRERLTAYETIGPRENEVGMCPPDVDSNGIVTLFKQLRFHSSCVLHFIATPRCVMITFALLWLRPLARKRRICELSISVAKAQ